MTAPQTTSNNTQVSTEEKRLKLTNTNAADSNNNAIFLEGCAVLLKLGFCLSRVNMLSDPHQGSRLVHVSKQAGAQNHY